VVIFAAMGALPWICALQFCAALCFFEGFEPIHEGEPPAVRGDAPSGLFIPCWAELRQQYGIERPQGWRSEIYNLHPQTSSFSARDCLHAAMEQGRLHMSFGLTSSLMTLLAALTIYVTSGRRMVGQ